MITTQRGSGLLQYLRLIEKTWREGCKQWGKILTITNAEGERY